MSSLEKNIYNDVKVAANKQTTTVPESRAYRGISTVNSDLNSFTLYDVALIKQDILNHFHIRQGEKLSDPTFGTIIWDLLYEPLTDTIRDLIAKNVTTIVNYDPRVEVNSITVDSLDNGIQIGCVLTYIPYSISEQLRLTFDRNTGLS